MSISDTKPPHEGIANSGNLSGDHSANLFMQDTVAPIEAPMNVTIVCYKTIVQTIVCYNNVVAIWLATAYSCLGRAKFALINYYECHYKVLSDHRFLTG